TLSSLEKSCEQGPLGLHPAPELQKKEPDEFRAFGAVPAFDQQRKRSTAALNDRANVRAGTEGRAQKMLLSGPRLFQQRTPMADPKDPPSQCSPDQDELN